MRSPHDDDPGRRRSAHRAGLATAIAAAVAIGGGAGAFVHSEWDDSAGSSVVSPPSLPADNAQAGGPPASMQKVAGRLLPSVVTITVTLPDGSGDSGSGAVLDSNGKIMTNNHVVADAKNGAGKISVTFNDGTSKSARIIGTDSVTDLAVIQADGVHDATPVTLGRSGDLVVGQPVIAIGSPLRQQLSGTVTGGIISAVNRPVDTSAHSQNPGPGSDAAQATVIDAIQTDAAINPGNSGGPLIDMDGKVVGINQSIPGSSSGNVGIGFAIPMDEARPILSTLSKGGTAEHAQLGVTVTDATTRLGAQLHDVTGKAAKDAGLQDGDIVTHVGDRQISNGDALVAAIRAHRPGDKITLTYSRNGTEHVTTATLGSDRGE